MNYKTYPTDYVQELNTKRGKSGRKKSRAFMEYWNDMEHGDKNSSRFYAESWEVSRSTSSEWINEFNHEIELFLNHWHVRNSQHYSYAQNQTEQNSSTNRAEIYATHTNNTAFQKNNRAPTEHQPSEAFNLYNNNNKAKWYFSPEFNDLYFIYGANTKFKGKKEEAFEVFKDIDIDVGLLKLAAVRYLHDPDTKNRRYNLTNFLKNEIFLSYLPKKIRITLDGVTRTGIYDDKTMLFTSETDKFVGQLSAARLLELYESQDLEFLKF